MNSQDSKVDRDGFVIYTFAGEEIAFIPCDMNDRQREKCLSGILRNMRDDCYAADTRDERS